MNKDIDNIDSTDKSVEKALDIMESSSEINVEQLQEMLKDEETLQACRDIMDSSLFLQQKSGMELPNIEMELERFKKKQYTARMRSNFWKVSMGIAAMIAVLFGTYYLINTLTTPALEPITVFTADAAPQHITLQKDNGEKIVLDEPQSNNQTLPQKMISKSEKKELDYRQVISTTTQTHVLTVPRGESFKVVLCDGTEVWLNANSNFVYPTAFIGDERIVTLEGEAYFKVAKDPERPFIVKTKTVQTRVLGTEFNIRSYTPE
ncbi:FecR family protein, partial [Bacteroides finegoldii]